MPIVAVWLAERYAAICPVAGFAGNAMLHHLLNGQNVVLILLSWLYFCCN